MKREQALANYSAAWNAPGAEAITAAFARCWTDRTTFTDTITNTIVGIAPMVQLVLDTAARYPGFTLHPVGDLDTHHTVGQFSWRMTAPDPIVAAGVDYGRELHGLDFVEFDADNRIARIVGFFLQQDQPSATMSHVVAP